MGSEGDFGGRTAVGQYWPTDESVSIFFDGSLRSQITEHAGTFSLSWQETITVREDYVVTAVSPSYTVSDTLTYTWNTLGRQGFWLTVENDYGFTSNRYMFEIMEQQIFLPIIAKITP